MLRIPRSFQKLDVPLPPILLELAEISKKHRFVVLYNWYSKPTWSDGKNCALFCFHTAWQPYIQHEAISRQLIGYDLGTENEEPKHGLVLDILQGKVYVAAIDAAIYFLNSQHPQMQLISACHWESVKTQELAYSPVTFDVMQKVGMLEMCVPSEPEHMYQVRALASWLDKYV